MSGTQAPRLKFGRKNPNRIKSSNFIAMDIFIYVAMGLIAFTCLWPFIYTASMSVSSPLAVMKRAVWLLPIPPLQVESYKLIFNVALMWRSYANTIFYVIATCILSVIICAMAAYPLATKGFRGRKFFVVYLMIPMFFSGGMIASFVTNARLLGLYNSPLAMILPGAFSIFTVILMRTYFYHSIPEAVKDAAAIDGASDFQILFQIMVPLSKPIFAVVALQTAVGTWNSWWNALLYIPDANWHPLQMFVARVLVLETEILNSLVSGAGMNAERMVASVSTALQIKYAVVIFSTLPIICVYPFVQKYFIKGVLIGSLKE